MRKSTGIYIIIRVRSGSTITVAAGDRRRKRVVRAVPGPRPFAATLSQKVFCFLSMTSVDKSPRMKRVKVIGGFALIVAGVLGVMLPIIPGTPLLIAGVALVGTDHPKI